MQVIFHSNYSGFDSRIIYNVFLTITIKNSQYQMIRSNKLVLRESYLLLNQEITMLNPKLFVTNNRTIRILIVSITCIRALDMTRDFCTLHAERWGKKKDYQCPTKDF